MCTTYSLNKVCPKGSALVVVITHIFYSYGPLRSGKISVIDTSLSLQISINLVSKLNIPNLHKLNRFSAALLPLPKIETHFHGLVI